MYTLRELLCFDRKGRELLAGKAPGPESPVEAVSGLSVRRPHLHSMDLQVQPGHNYRIATAFWFLCISFPILSFQYMHL